MRGGRLREVVAKGGSTVIVKSVPLLILGLGLLFLKNFIKTFTG